jgi:poly(3-hydroxybutyrate) depolymerase
MKCNALFLIFLVIAVVTNAQERYLDSIFSDVTGKTYNYAIKDTTALKFDFYESGSDTVSRKPLFVFVHGGGFSTGKRDHPEIVKLATQVASRGYAVASVSYRLTRKGKSFGCNCPAEEKKEAFRACGEDIMDAILFILEQPDIFHIDPYKIILTGSSAGAEGVLNIAYNKELLFKYQPRYKNFTPAAVISLAGAILDKRYINKKNAIPGIFFHGTKDPLVPYKSGPHHYCREDQVGYLILDGSAAIVSKLEDLNKSFLFYSILGANHDVFKIPFKQLQEIFDFMHKTVINQQFYQARVSVNNTN